MAYIEISRALIDTRQSTLTPSTYPPSSPTPAPRSPEPCSRLRALGSSAFSSPGPQFGQSTASDVELSSSSHSPNCAGLHSQQVSASTSSSHTRCTSQWLHCSSNSSTPPIRLVKDRGLYILRGGLPSFTSWGGDVSGCLHEQLPGYTGLTHLPGHLRVFGTTGAFGFYAAMNPLAFVMIFPGFRRRNRSSWGFIWRISLDSGWEWVTGGAASW